MNQFHFKINCINGVADLDFNGGAVNAFNGGAVSLDSQGCKLLVGQAVRATALASIR